MGELIHKFILITGLMGSGKSTIINEFVYQRPTAEFTPPPVEAKFRGQDFEFVDQIFALKRDNFTYNFYELDAPTVNKWFQFIHIADAIIIAYNFRKTDYFESSEVFISNLKSHARSKVPFYFVVTNCDDEKDAKSVLEEQFHISTINDRLVDLRYIEPGEAYFTKKHGKRISVPIEKLEQLYMDVIASIE